MEATERDYTDRYSQRPRRRLRGAIHRHRLCCWAPQVRLGHHGERRCSLSLEEIGLRRAGESTATVLQKEKAGRSLARSLPEEKRKGGPPPFYSRSQPTPHPGAMACGATLKRTIDFDPLLSPPSQSPKRRRCTPLNSASSPQKYLKMQPSPFGEVTPRLTTEQILHNIKQEYKRIQKRRHLESFLHQSEGSCSSDTQSQIPVLNGPALQGTSSGSLSPQSKKDQPLFTLRQVGIICERLIKEREEKIREEYEEILDTKLAEQYDTFVKFTHDQIMRRYGEQPASYVS